MSGSDKKSSKPKTGTTAAAPQPSMTVQPFMPGMDQALAQQLSAGFGGAPADFLAAFQQSYAPMQVPTNAVYTPAPAKTPAKAAINKSPGLSSFLNGDDGRKSSGGGRFRGGEK